MGNRIVDRMISSKSESFERRLGRRGILSSGREWTLKTDAPVSLSRPSFSLSLQDGVTSLTREGSKTTLNEDPLDYLDKMLDRGYYALGFFSYEFFKYLKMGVMPKEGKEDWPIPELSFLFFEESNLVKSDFENFSGGPAENKVSPISNMTKESYIQMVNKARQYIARGDIYQANLSQRFETTFEIQPEQFLFKLQKAQPVPLACCIDFGEFQLISGSMELFLRKQGRQIVTRPIKGTRKRGADKMEDQALREELYNSKKERAENLMIVDLMRNDLGRVCELGSVRVNRLFEIESYTTLFQMMSEVEGKLLEETTISDIVKNTFPPGSVTGAPKVRAMEIIGELEPHLRGPYCGAIGLFKPDGDFVLSVAIRVLVSSRGKGTFWVGGGIMWDSIPEQEYIETLVKAEAIMRALG